MAASKILLQVESVARSGVEGSAGLPAAGKAAKRVSVGRRWKLRRNLVIYIANQQGVSQRMLADVFDLPHSRIAAILKEFRTNYGQSPRRPLE